MEVSELAARSTEKYFCGQEIIIAFFAHDMNSYKGTEVVCKQRNRVHILENCAVLGYYATSSGLSLPTFPDNLSVPSSRVKKMGPIDCPETSVRSCHYSLHNNLEERSSHLLRGGSLKSRKEHSFHHHHHHIVRPCILIVVYVYLLLSMYF